MQNNQLFLSPVREDKQLHRVLDAGCGTGIWSMDVGKLKDCLLMMQSAGLSALC